MKRPALVMGIETEYSIYPQWHMAENLPQNPTFDLASKQIVQEAFSLAQVMGPQLIRAYGGVFTQFLHNGARMYNDMQAPEYCTPECPNPYWVVMHDQAGMLIEEMAVAKAAQSLGYPIDLYKKNSDGLGNTYGCHENFCVSPRLFEELIRLKLNPSQTVLGTFLLVRQVLTGAGKVGVEEHQQNVVFQLTQRMDFLTDFRNNTTTSNRPLIQQREEPHADKDRWQRFHYIMGDANMCQESTYLKMGLTALMLMLLQDGERASYHLPMLKEGLEYPKIGQRISWDTEMSAQYPVVMTSRNSQGVLMNRTAPDILMMFVSRLATYVRERSFRDEEERRVYADIVARADRYLDLIRAGKSHRLYGILDWPTKRGILEHFLNKKGRTFADALTDTNLLRQLRALERSFCRVDQKNGLYYRLFRKGQITRVVPDAEILRAVLFPPPGRAELRTLIVDKLLHDVKTNGVNWHQVQVPHPFKDSDTWTIKLPDPLVMVNPLMRDIIESSSDGREMDRRLKELRRSLPGKED